MHDAFFCKTHYERAFMQAGNYDTGFGKDGAGSSSKAADAGWVAFA